MEIKKNWFRRHIYLTVFLVLFGLPILIGIISSISDNSPSQTTNLNEAPISEAASATPLIEEKKDFPVVITSSSITSDSIGYPVFNAKIKNNSDKTIDAVEVITKFTNNFDEVIGEFGITSNPYFKGSIQDKIAPGTSYDGSWSIIGYTGAKKIKDPEIYRVHFTDGTSLSQE